ncbi:MIT domain-containing protein 1-like [Babylonia areolata]|uniref:MIT domain-containing protein 1-like n=1 Tax=Babylonia areolata TaxID=304850 RepID=UPI003FCEFEE1
MEGMEASAIGLLKRAVDLDRGGERMEEAVTLYQEGVSLLLQVMKATSDSAKKLRMREKIEEYLKRAEDLKTHIKGQKEAGKYHEQIRIANDSVGHSYNSLFGKFIEESLTSVEIEDPYIRSVHQIYNFLRFCELLVRKKSSLKKIVLITSLEENQNNKETQIQRLDQIRKSLQTYNVQLIVQYSSTLHDREIRFDTGWVIKIGRGLDIYKPTENKFCIGFCDFDLRLCHETTVDIFHRKFVKDGAAAGSS